MLSRFTDRLIFHPVIEVRSSFPPTDTRPVDLFRSLFAVRGSEISVEIVAPGVDEIAKRIGDDCLGKVKEVKLHNIKLEEYVSLISESSPSLMRQAAHEYPAITIRLDFARASTVWLQRLILLIPQARKRIRIVQGNSLTKR